MPIPLIDLFAGPGGLGEGFTSRTDTLGGRLFQIRLSIEMDFWAHQTLSLRAFFRQFPAGDAPDDYYAHLRGEITRAELFQRHPDQASHALGEAWHAMLGAQDQLSETRGEQARNATPRGTATKPDYPSEACIDAEIRARLGQDITRPWVLIGGPPCQAYSLVGRSRMIGERGREDFEKDHRHFLYRHYLRIIAVHQPTVFVMENVKGLLSARVGGTRMFEKIRSDLKAPRLALFRETDSDCQYDLYPLPDPSCALNGMEPAPEDFIIHSEDYGVPQKRHRVIILGVKKGLPPPRAISHPYRKGIAKDQTALWSVIGDLPKLRSGLTEREDSAEAWNEEIRTLGRQKWFTQRKESDPVLRTMAAQMDKLRLRSKRSDTKRHGEIPMSFSDWYIDPRMDDFVCNHETRAHITSDLHRYLFVASYALVHNKTPCMADFPSALLPKHKNVDEAINGAMFGDRFRVQVSSQPATTVTSHISKDGHYFIHPDPTQCRSLSVREAARIQTFPDNYLFAGPRTEQYHQVGNAVPPLLSRQISAVVHDLLKRWHGGPQ